MPAPDPDTSHASPGVAALLTAYHKAKWDHDLDAWLAFFAPDARYVDATLGWVRDSRAELRTQLAQVVPTWGQGRSWATRVVGGDTGAVVAVVDDPQLFGAEIRALSAVTVHNGLITRFVDHWDSRHFGTARAQRLRRPDVAGAAAVDLPVAADTSNGGPSADAAMDRRCAAVQTALAVNDVGSVVAALARDCVWEDLTLHTQLVGTAAIERYLHRTAGRLPYAAGAATVSVLGGGLGGGWEWHAPDAAVRTGVIAVELDPHGMISRWTAVWDGGQVSDAEIAAMTAWGIEPGR